MRKGLPDRLNGLAERILSPDILEGRGLGNEIAFFVFEYEPASELDVRAFLPSLIRQIGERMPNLRLAHVDLLDIVKSLLDKEDLWSRAVSLESSAGATKSVSALQRFANAERVAEHLARIHPPSATDLYLISGVGAAYPLARAHAVLSNLHSRIEGRPLVLLFPGSFSGMKLSLFDKLLDDHYYRAFRLEP